MTAATSRIQINVPTYMSVDGQWQIVLPGSVIDLNAKTNISTSCCVPLAESPGTLAPHGGSTSVRNLRTR